MGRITLLLGIALSLGIAHSQAATASSSKAKPHAGRHDRIYGYVDGEPDYCGPILPHRKDSRSCIAQRKALEPEIAQLEAEQVAMKLRNSMEQGSPKNVDDACAQAKAPDVNACANHLLVGWPSAHHNAASFDSYTYCRKIGDIAGGSNEIELTCRQEENEARQWFENHDTSARTFTYCLGIGKIAGGSYVILKTCIEQEEEAGSKL